MEDLLLIASLYCNFRLVVGVGSWKLEASLKKLFCSVVLFSISGFFVCVLCFVFCRHFQNHNGSMVFNSHTVPYVGYIVRLFMIPYTFTLLLYCRSFTARGRRRNKKKRNNDGMMMMMMTMKSDNEKYRIQNTEYTKK